MDRDSLTKYHIFLKAQKPSNKPYPKSLITIGDHIKKRRIDLNLTHKEAAKLLGVQNESICNWEHNYCTPKIHMLPKTIQFLGYVPFESSKQTMNDKIKAY
jgi:DNA-binding XRE family transcriptional regulator